MYKEYDDICATYNGYKGRIYKDNMFGMEFGNASVYDQEGREIFHVTIDANKEYTKDDVIGFIKSAIVIIQNENGE